MPSTNMLGVEFPFSTQLNSFRRTLKVRLDPRVQPSSLMDSYIQYM